ncbi:hypothetical protein Tco_1302795 [Tanacetum coccineum]
MSWQESEFRHETEKETMLVIMIERAVTVKGIKITGVNVGFNLDGSRVSGYGSVCEAQLCVKIRVDKYRNAWQRTRDLLFCERRGSPFSLLTSQFIVQSLSFCVYGDVISLMTLPVEPIPDAMCWRHHDSDISDPAPKDGFDEADVIALTHQSIDIRGIPFKRHNL